MTNQITNKKLLDQVRDTLHLKHYPLSTEESRLPSPSASRLYGAGHELRASLRFFNCWPDWTARSQLDLFEGVISQNISQAVF